MAGSSIGTLFRVTTWGESHGAGIGAVVDGCPAGLPLCEEDIQKFLDRRKPGSSQFTTQRKESDCVKILSGVFEAKTTGTPISLMIPNTSQISKDYSNIMNSYRPGHADYGFDSKYGFRDYRGGGRSSGRETAGRVAAGAIAIKLLENFGITFLTYVDQVGPVKIDESRFSVDEITKNALNMPDSVAAKEAEAYLAEKMSEKDSSGASITCKIQGCPVGLGEPVFDKMDAKLAQAIVSIGAVKAIEIGDGKSVVSATGTSNNDAFHMEDGQVRTLTNHAGGILGGMTNGEEILLHIAVKPTPSIFQEQKTVNRQHEDVTMTIAGRHDPIIAPRACVVVEAMSALMIADALMQNAVSRLDNLQKVYGLLDR